MTKIKILVLTCMYLPNPSANGINTKYIIEELKKRGYEITCISIKRDNETKYEIIENTPVYRLDPSLYTRMTNKISNIKPRFISGLSYNAIRVLRKIKSMLLIVNFPNFDIIQARRIFRTIETLHRKNRYDCIIGVFKPYANIAALKLFKRKHPEVMCIGYYLDLITSLKRPMLMPVGFYDRLCYNEDIKTFKLLDTVLMAKGGEHRYNNPVYDSVREKIHYVDFPTFITSKNDICDKRNTDNSKIVMTYAGTLDREYRNPELLLEALTGISSSVGAIELNIFGKHNCNNIFNKYNNTPLFRINDYGFMPHESVLEKMYESDFLINISNKIQNAVPSKIFELFSTGKPIISVIFDKNDITTRYFEQYIYVFNINAWESISYQTDKLLDFIKKHKGLNYSTDQILARYYQNTPSYTVNIIEEKLKRFLKKEDVN
ncbi:MAG TPA: hypothetical protein PLZ84_00945 [Clostridia bacterium]|nr:hypothetical protein [Clostridia bacterium]